MPGLNRFNLKNHCYFVTNDILDFKPLFQRGENADLLIKIIYRCRAKYRFLLLGFVIMPDHFHCLIVPAEGRTISAVMQKIKSIFAVEYRKKTSTQGQIWQKSFYDHIIRDERDFQTKINYIHNNPVKLGLVERAEDYRYSSANPKFETDWEKFL